MTILKKHVNIKQSSLILTIAASVTPDTLMTYSSYTQVEKQSWTIS